MVLYSAVNLNIHHLSKKLNFILPNFSLYYLNKYVTVDSVFAVVVIRITIHNS